MSIINRISLRINIESGNDAMRSPQDVSEVLKDLSERISSLPNHPGYSSSGVLRDINGNSVGNWRIDLSQ